MAERLSAHRPDIAGDIASGLRSAAEISMNAIPVQTHKRRLNGDCWLLSLLPLAERA
jgi:hypothetical protein